MRGRGRRREALVRMRGRRGRGASDCGSGHRGTNCGGRGGVDNFTLGEVAEGGASVLQGHGVGGVCGGELVPRRDGALHVLLPLLASVDRLFVLDLRLRAAHCAVGRAESPP